MSKLYIHTNTGLEVVEAMDSTHYYFTKRVYDPVSRSEVALPFSIPKHLIRVMKAKPASYFTTQKHKGNRVDVKRRTSNRRNKG